MAYDPLEVFPLPVWECILEKLRKEGSSRDVLNCSKVCTEFQRILEPAKQEWLFGSICPFILPYLKGGQLLGCRKVCKSWRRGVDNFLEDFETWHPFNEETSDISRSTHYDPLQHRKIKWTNFKNDCAAINFLDAMKRGEMKTPFVGRSVSLGDSDGFECRGRMRSEFLERALELLSLYGDHIWHLRVVPKHDFNSCHFYQILKKILSCTPNIKSLILDLSYRDRGYYEEKIDKLKNLLLEDHPLPEILSLETLEIISYSTPIVILEKLISNFNLGNLKCLKLQYNAHLFGRTYNAELEPHVGVTPLQHLTELQVSGIQWDELEHMCNNMISPTAPLGKISWTFPGQILTLEIDFDRMCNIINRSKTTLRMLAIQGDHIMTKARLFLSKLEAPNLKSLELQEITFETGALPPALTASLEYLHIRYIYSYWVHPGEEFWYNEDTLHESSIWKEMKKLKVIRILNAYSETGGGCDGLLKIVCTRQMHELGIPAKTVLVGNIPNFISGYYDSDDDSDDDSDEDSDEDSDADSDED